MKTTYAVCQSISASMNERNDCTVKALAITAGIEYQQAHRILAVLGRKNSRGLRCEHHTMVNKMRAAVMMADKIVSKAEYPQGLTLKTIGQWRPHGSWLVFTSGHVAAMIDGKVDDWAADSKRRVKYMIRVGV